ncbi:MAG: nitroreductase family protein [Candidatus Omnitrophica bacterium]|nr:nitroreductase family protein [Candidatus Omnitrophota bacterium]
MKFLELVKKRKSCRKYISKPVSREIIEKCILAARDAPSACNSQPWHFIVVENENIRKEIAKKAFSGVYSMNNFAKNAPVLIVIVRENSKVIARIGEFYRRMKYNLIDIGIACEHFILAAAEEGLGTCWLGWFDEKWVKKKLDIGRNKKIDIIIALGYSGETEYTEKARKPIDEICEYR